jgi:hypothetical protein
MTLLRRIVEKEHKQTRLDISGVDGKVDDLSTQIDDQTTTISGALDTHDTSVDSQLTSILSAVNSLQNDVSAAISFPGVLERPDEGSEVKSRIYFYNYADGINADLVAVPSIRVLDLDGNPIDNGTTGGDVSINNVVMTKEGGTTGIYYYDFYHDFPNAGSPNADVGSYRLEIKTQESSGPDTFAYHPRSFEVVELSGIQSGFDSLETSVAGVSSNVDSVEARMESLMGATDLDTDGTNIYDEILEIQATLSNISTAVTQTLPNAISDVSTLVNTTHGITDGLFEVSLPLIGSTSALLDGDPTDLSGTPVVKVGNTLLKFSEFLIQVPVDTNKNNLAVYNSVVTYDLSWKSQITVGSAGISAWAISSSQYGAAEDLVGSPTGRIITSNVTADTDETRHSLYGEILDSIHTDGEWYLTLAGRGTNAPDSLTLTPLAETRVSFVYSVSSKVYTP